MARNNRNRNKGQESTTINNSILDELKDISSDETLVETLEKEEENTNEVEEITEISPGVKGQLVKMKLPIKCEKDWILRRKKQT